MNALSYDDVLSLLKVRSTILLAAALSIAAGGTSGCAATGAPVEEEDESDSSASGVTGGAEDRMTVFMRCDSRRWSRSADVQDGAIVWDTGWTGGEDASAGLPGAGPVQAANNFMAGGSLHQSIWRDNRHHYRAVPYDPLSGKPNWGLSSGWTDVTGALPGYGDVQTHSGYVLGDTLYEAIWRGNQGFVRHIPIANGSPMWHQPIKDWAGPISNAGLPGAGDMQSQNDYLLNGRLRQGFWRGNQGFWRDVPIEGGAVMWPHASAWSLPIPLSAMPCQSAMETASTYFDYAAAPPPKPQACRSVGTWRVTDRFADDGHRSHPLPSFSRGNRYYVHSISNGGSGDRILYMATQNGDGSLGPWVAASGDHGGGPHGFTAITAGGEAYHFRNGHIARYDFGADGSLKDVSTQESNPDQAFGGNRYVWDSAVTANLGSGPSFVFHLGGFSFTGYQYRPDVYRSGVPLGSSFAPLGAQHPAKMPGKSAFFSAPGMSVGFIFTGQSGGSGLWRAEVSADGSLSGWVSLGSMPAGSGNERGDLWVAGQTLFTVRGARVFAADIDADRGAISAWREMPGLPAEQIDVSWGGGHVEGASYGIIGDWVYLTGQHEVMFAPLLPSSCEAAISG